MHSLVDAAVFIPAVPLGGFLLLVLAGRRLGDPWAGWVATLATTGGFAAAAVTYAALLSHGGDHRSFTQTLFTWIPVGGLRVNAALLVDPLSVTMALFVTGVGALIHLYSIGYMRGDPDFAKYFVYLNLFAFSMLALVLGDSLLVTFLGWEGVGTCSYLLISFWFERERPPAAGKKAFITNRVGDFGFLLAMFLTFGTLGTLRYSEIFARAGQLSKGTVTAVTLLLFLGAVGKSAQIPLYIWLPDAMEGPTPVSALIHAATMVTAGVYLMARISPLLARAPATATTIAVMGVATALFAATIACVQNDIKRVLAYSTISQLGYMFLAVGAGAYTAAIFHMVTHAFFKALLFLGAGSVIHGLHDEQDMKRMGGLRRWMPVTAATFIVGWLAIAGVPPFAGFWSKDAILLNAYDKSPVLWALGLITALFTAYYMTRQVYLVFFGTERWRQAQGEEHGRQPHEAPATMLLPLVTLALLSLAGGALNLPFTDKLKVLEHWLAPVFGPALREVSVGSGLEAGLAAGSAAVALLGVVVGLQLWRGRAQRPQLEPVVLQRAWGVDDAVSAFVAGPGTALGRFTAEDIDAGLIDGAVNGLGALVRAAGSRLRRVQTGYVRNYALGVAGGTVLLLAYAVIRAR